MKLKAVSGIMLTLLLIGMLTFTFNIQPVEGLKVKWTVDDNGPANFHTIQEAINAANPGDTIYVYNGTYYENVVVNKTVSLIGENKSNTIVDAGGIGTVMSITADHVTVTGFTIQNSGTQYEPLEGGIYCNTMFSNISGNLITSNHYYGIYLSYSYYTNIQNNTITTTFFYGIYLDHSNYNSVSNNTVMSPTQPMFGIGIYITDSDRNNVDYNTIMMNGDGIRLGHSSYNTFRGNRMIGNSANFGVEGWELSHFIHDIDTSNTVDGKPICYLINQHDLIIDPSVFPDIGYIGLVNSENITVRDLNLTNNLQGVLFAYTRDSTIERVTATNNGRGVHLFSSDNNTITCNTLTLNGYGIDVSYSIDTNIRDNIILGGSNGILLWHVSYSAVTRNIISNAGGTGIDLRDSDGNKLSENNVTGNTCGIYTSDANGNSIFHNNFIDNIYDQVRNPEAYYSVNIWDYGYPSGGNYWSDYVGVDVKSGAGQDLPGSDGIGDSPYVIDENNADHYPLMVPYGAPPPTTYNLTITATVGGTTDPATGTYGYTVNSTFQVTATPEAGYLFDHWELDSVDVGSANPYTVLMDKDHTLKAVFSVIPPPLSASISPLSASITVGESLTFTSTVSGGYTPYSYQWYLNGNPVSGATSDNWTVTPTTSGIYYVYLKVTDAKGNTTQSETARITAASVPVGGYSFPIQVQTKAEPIIPYIALMAILTAIFTKLRPKTKRKH